MWQYHPRLENWYSGESLCPRRLCGLHLNSRDGTYYEMKSPRDCSIIKTR